jgi:hypothetical protein
MKRRAKAIHAELRKGSTAFDGWLKYEVTIEYPDGKKEKVPAYGKDLQDALSRVAHDKKVEQLAKTKLPLVTGIFLSVLIASTFAVIGFNLDRLGDNAGPVVVAAVGLLSTLTLSIVNWFNIKSTAK